MQLASFAVLFLVMTNYSVTGDDEDKHIEDNLKQKREAGPKTGQAFLLENDQKSEPMKFRKRAPLRFGKRVPMRFGKRFSSFTKKTPFRFGKRTPLIFYKRDIEEPERVDEEYADVIVNKILPIGFGKTDHQKYLMENKNTKM